MEPTTKPTARIIMNVPVFNPADVLMVETYVGQEMMYYLLFLYCNSQISMSYLYYDELAMLAAESEWGCNLELSLVDAFNRMGVVMFHTLATNNVLGILLVADVSEVELLNPATMVVTYSTEGLVSELQQYNLGYFNGSVFNFNPANVNYPHSLSVTQSDQLFK